MPSLSFNAIGGLLYKPYPISCQLCFLGLFTFLPGCSLSIPEGIKPVSGFDINQYMGRWYEIARLDNRFQRGLERVTATYSLREDGSVCVENSGWHSQKRQQKTVVGKAKFVLDKQVGHLKVSFWGPFYGSYIVFYLEADYSVAMVCGNSREYCWILAREPVISAEELSRYQKIAEEKGFAVENLIYTQSPSPNH